MSTEFNLNGFREEPESEKHWSFEDKLRAKMVRIAAGDVDLRQWTSARHNQRSTSTCVAQSTCKALAMRYKTLEPFPMNPSIIQNLYDPLLKVWQMDYATRLLFLVAVAMGKQCVQIR